MAFWNNDDARNREAAKRREEERLRRAADDRRRDARVKAARQQARALQKQRRIEKAEQSAEDKKLRDELVEKMLRGGGSGTEKKHCAPLNRSLGGDRAQPTERINYFKNSPTQPGGRPGHTGGAAAEGNDETSQGRNEAQSAFPPLKRPF